MTGAGEVGRHGRPSLLLSDVDGTMVTDDKVLTEATRRAVGLLRMAGIRFAITSSRPPAGLATVVAALAIDTPIAAFNGGMIVAPDDPSRVMAQYLVPAQIGAHTLAMLAQQGIDAWVFTAEHWLLRRPDGPYVGHEEHTVSFPPTVVDDFGPYLDRVGKIVAVSDDFGRLELLEGEVRQALGESAAVVRSQAYYLDVTHPRANKGTAVLALAEHLGIPTHAIATIGDGRNDMAMFAQAGMSIAMGNAEPEVKEAADLVMALTNEQDGFAAAIERHLLGWGKA